MHGFTIERWNRTSVLATLTLCVVIVVFAAAPYLVGANSVDQLTTLFVYLILAGMWNALAGYAGLVSVGQQAFFGLGAYFTVQLSNHGVGVYLSLILAALITGLVSIPTSFFVLRLRAGVFAIGTWVVAETFHLLVDLDHSVGGVTGTSLSALNTFSASNRRDYNYWTTFGVCVALLATTFVLLRSRTGASLQAIRDDEDAAASVGVRVLGTKWIVYVFAAVGCGAAGALWLATSITFQPDSFFSVQWTAYMIFMVLVGGIGTFEGPLIGAVVFFLIQNQFGDQGVWYLVGLGGSAVVFALFFPRGIWGSVVGRYGIRLLPVGYHLRRSGPE
jgi:branched-chain amino acid transport system permease protein